MSSASSPLLGNAAEPDDLNIKGRDKRTVVIKETDGVINTPATDARVSPLLYFSLFSCVIGTSFQFGYALGALNTSEHVIKNAFRKGFSDSANATDVITSDSEITFLWSATVSIYCLGGMLAGSVGGAICERFGRKRTMMLLNTFQIISPALMFASLWLKRYEPIIAGRFIAGLHGGISTVVCPMYLNEVSTMSIRGVAGILNQFTVVISLALAQVLGLPQLLGTDDYFYYILGAPVVPAVIHWVFLAFCPESPSWLYIHKKDRNGAREALERLRIGPVNEELDQYHEEELVKESQPSVRLKDMFTTYRFRPLVVVAVMHTSQQLSGINAVIFYSTTIFESASLELAEAQYATIGLGGINILMTFVSMILIEKLGRRTLHLHGLGGMFIMHALLTACLLVKDIQGMEWARYGCIVFIALFIVSFSIGPGSIPWFYASELFDPGSSSWAISMGVVINWLCNFAVGLLFPSINTGLQNYAFFPFMALLAIFWFFLYLNAPETKGRSTAQVMHYFKDLYERRHSTHPAKKNYETFT